MTKLKKAIKGTQATSKIPASKLPASTRRPTSMEASDNVMDAHRFRHSNNNEGGMSGPVEDIEALRAERDKLTNEEKATMLASTPLTKAVPSLSPDPLVQEAPAPLDQPSPIGAAAPATKAPEKERPLLTHELYTKMTGKSWATAKKEGLTDGSFESNMKLRAALLSGKSTAASKSTSTEAKKATPATKTTGSDDLKKKLATPMVKKAPATSTKSASETAHDKMLDARRRQQSEATRNISTKDVSDLVKKNQGSKYSKVTVRTAFQKQQDEDDEFERIKGYRPAPRGIVPINRGKSVTSKPIKRKGKGVIQNPVGIYGLR